MPRLPIPGSDDGVWGDVLNDYLTVAHDTDGTIKANAVDAAALQDNSVSGAKLQDDSVTNAKLNSGSGSNGQVLTKNNATAGGFEWTSAAGSPDATTSSKGIVQLAGDLAGTAATPTVPALANKANTTTTISAGTGLTGGGDLSANRTLSADFGTTAGTIAQGNDSRIVGAEQTANKGAVSGYAGLDGSSKVPIAQLPTGTTSTTVAIGNDARIVGAIQSTLVDAKGDVIAATAADTVTRLAVGSDGQVLTANSTQSAGIAWATPVGEVYPLSGYGFVAATDDISAHTVDATVGAGVTRIFVPAGKAITAVGIFVYAAGTLGAGGLNGFAVYDDAGVLVETTSSDNSLYTTAGWRFLNLNSVIPAQASGRFVRVHRAVSGYSGAPSVLYAVCGTSSNPAFVGGFGVPNHRRVVYTSDISSYPASFTPAAYGTVTEYLPLVALG